MGDCKIMMKQIQVVGIVGKHKESRHIIVVKAVAEYCTNRGLQVLMEAETAEKIGEYPPASYDLIGKNAQLLIVVGGDGFMLQAARKMAAYGVPIVGVNRGRLGFLTDLASEGLSRQLDAMFEGRFIKENRFMLEGYLIREGKEIDSLIALNDVYLCRGDSDKMIEFDMFVDGQFVYQQRSDGIIISTPTGSTAYALSANGPILHPSVKAIALTPLCAHSLSSRPIAVSADARIECDFLRGEDAYLHFDGQVRIPVKVGDRILVKKSQCNATLLLPSHYNYFSILRQKLHWSETPSEQWL